MQTIDMEKEVNWRSMAWKLVALAAIIGGWYGGDWLWDLWPHSDDRNVIRDWASGRCGEARQEALQGGTGQCTHCAPTGGKWRAPLCGVAEDSGPYGTVEWVLQNGTHNAFPRWSKDSLLPPVVTNP